MKNVMRRAWEIAREGVKKFGGKVKEYFAQALHMAWAEIKKGVSDMVELQGSEKQVKWANDIRNKAVEMLNDVLAFVTKFEAQAPERVDGLTNEVLSWKTVKLLPNQKALDLSRDNIEKLVEAIENEVSAKFFIENRENILNAIAEKHEVKNAFGRIINSYRELKSGKVQY